MVLDQPAGAVLVFLCVSDHVALNVRNDRRRANASPTGVSTTLTRAGIARRPKQHALWCASPPVPLNRLTGEAEAEALNEHWDARGVNLEPVAGADFRQDPWRRPGDLNNQ
jgi:hypothetical protein